MKAETLTIKLLIFHILNNSVPDPCNPEPCDTHAVCARDSVLNTDFICTCILPFEGDGFSCEGMSCLFVVYNLHHCISLQCQILACMDLVT